MHSNVVKGSRPVVTLTVSGASGRMGREVITHALGDERLRIVSLWEYPLSDRLGLVDPQTGLKIEPQWGSMEVGEVIIDFSLPDGLSSLLEGLKGKTVALVSGTTGLSSELKSRLDAAASYCPVFHSSNMSVGIAVLKRLVRQAVCVTGPDWDVEIVEIHHNRKVDAPSGTAVSLAEEVGRGRGEALEIRAGRFGVCGPRGKGELGVHAVRGGDVVGEHEVILAGQGENLRLRHVATSRSVFAAGACRAALWLSGREPGLYSMNDLLESV